MPECIACDDDPSHSEFLYAYAHTYLKEEIWMEQFIKELDPFRKFLEVAAQCNGKIINFSLLCIEIESSTEIHEQDIKSFIKLSCDIKNSESICISNDKYVKKIQHVKVMQWKVAMLSYFTG